MSFFGKVRPDSRYFAKGVSATEIWVWEVANLKRLSASLTREDISISELPEMDSNVWFHDEIAQPTIRNVADHAGRILKSDLALPIILSRHLGIMDGMHRIAKAYLLGHAQVSAVRFEVDPLPDFVMSVTQLYHLTHGEDVTLNEVVRPP